MRNLKNLAKVVAATTAAGLLLSSILIDVQMDGFVPLVILSVGIASGMIWTELPRGSKDQYSTENFPYQRGIHDDWIHGDD